LSMKNHIGKSVMDKGGRRKEGGKCAKFGREII